MSVIYLLIIVSLLVAIIFLVIFFIAVSNGQYEDCDTPAMRMLFKDNIKNKQTKQD